MQYYGEALIEENKMMEDFKINGVGDGKSLDEECKQLIEHNWICKAGIARMCLKIGDLRRFYKHFYNIFTIFIEELKFLWKFLEE